MIVHLGVYNHLETSKDYIYLCKAYDAPEIVQLYDIVTETGLGVSIDVFNREYRFTGKVFDDQTGSIIEKNII